MTHTPLPEWLPTLLTPDDLPLLRIVKLPVAWRGSLPDCSTAEVPRAQLAMALTLMLFARLLREVPEARRYMNAVCAAGQSIAFDHGAVRTVLANTCGTLPSGEASITRVLHPLGYASNGLYPLDRLGMTGRAYIHPDAPQDIPQFFLSELHPERFSGRFQNTVDEILVTSRDPLTDDAKGALDKLGKDRRLPLDMARKLLPELAACFARQHALPSSAQYDTLLAESAEMAWISTEGQTFNHATDRVDDVHALAARLRAEGYAIKDKVEVSQSGRVRQTALRAALVQRSLGCDEPREVPGSFFEFISRSALPGTEFPAGMDMGFDTGNATGIFRMTAR